jgi:hypothetical protein
MHLFKITIIAAEGFSSTIFKNHLPKKLHYTYTKGVSFLIKKPRFTIFKKPKKNLKITHSPVQATFLGL